MPPMPPMPQMPQPMPRGWGLWSLLTGRFLFFFSTSFFPKDSKKNKERPRFGWFWMQPNGITVTLLIVTSTNDLKILILGTKFFLLGVRGRDVTSYVCVITARCSVWEQTWSVCGATGEICVEKRCGNSEWLAVLVHFVKPFRNCNVALHSAIPPLFCVGSISRWIDCSLQSVILFPADNEDSFPGVVGSEFLSFERPDETRQTVHIGVKWHLVNVQPPALGEPCFYIAFCEDHRTFCLRFLLLVCAVKGVKLATDLSANRPHQTGPGILDMEPVESSLTAVDQSESLEVKHCRATSLHWQSLGKEGWRILSAVVPWTLGIVW